MGSDRPAALLTESQREYIRGEREIDNASHERSLRSRIRERVHAGILDFSLLFKRWDEREREEVLGWGTDGEIGDALADLIALVYAEAGESGLRHLLLRGVQKAEQRLAGSDLYNVNVEFEVETPPKTQVKKAVEKFESGKLHRLTDGEAQAIVKLLRKSETVSSTELEEMRQEWVEQIVEEVDEAHFQRSKTAREKQARKRDDE